MPERLPERLYDGISTSEGGVDTSVVPALVPRNRLRGAYNVTVRGGRPRPRPGYNQRTLDFDGDATRQTNFETGRFQGAGTYYADTGEPYLVAAIGGRVFRIDLTNGYQINDISVTGDLNSNLTQCHFEQAEQFLLMQDGQSLCYIFDGTSARRANPNLNEVPTGTVMAYGMGRLWVARGRYFVAGDIVFGSSGSAAYNYRDAVLKFTENTYIAEGGDFYVPAQYGNITALTFPARQDTATGEGALKVFTHDTVFSINVPVDRATWAAAAQLTQTVTLIGAGALSAASVASVNSDLYFRSRLGVSSLQQSQRFFGMPGNTPLSHEMTYYLQHDTDWLLQWSSAVLFDDRLLVTAWPRNNTVNGIYHTGILALDFSPIANIQGRLPPAWEGAWTGLNVLRLITVNVNGSERCFAFVLSSSNIIQLWEISKADKFDSGSTNITWEIETGALGSISATPPTRGNPQLLRLEGGALHVADLTGTATFNVWFSPDQHNCWYSWVTDYTRCANRCDTTPDTDPCQAIANYQPQYRRIVMPAPAESCNTPVRLPNVFGYEFRARVRISGYCELLPLRLRFRQEPEEPYGGDVCTVEQSCQSVTCCSVSPP